MYTLKESDRARRDRLNIMSDILEIAKENTLKTQIMYKANLSFTQLNKYLSFMLKFDLITLTISEGREIYTITEKGSEFLQVHRELSKMLKSKCKI